MGAKAAAACLRHGMDIRLAVTSRARLRGLLGRRTPPPHGLLLAPARSVHTFGMRFPIDVVFLDADLRVVAVLPAVAPGRVVGERGARAALELPAGGADGIETGDRLDLVVRP